MVLIVSSWRRLGDTMDTKGCTKGTMAFCTAEDTKVNATTCDVWLRTCHRVLRANHGAHCVLMAAAGGHDGHEGLHKGHYGFLHCRGHKGECHNLRCLAENMPSCPSCKPWCSLCPHGGGWGTRWTRRVAQRALWLFALPRTQR